MNSFCDHAGRHTPGLPFSVLRLLVPPIRLVSAAIWKTIQQRVVPHYGMLEEFISMVTDIVPEILTIDQRVQLTLGLRARVRRIVFYLRSNMMSSWIKCLGYKWPVCSTSVLFDCSPICISSVCYNLFVLTLMLDVWLVFQSSLTMWF